MPMLLFTVADNVLTITDDTVTDPVVRRREVYHLVFAHITADDKIAKVEAIDYPLHHPYLKDKSEIKPFFHSCSERAIKD